MNNNRHFRTSRLPVFLTRLYIRVAIKFSCIDIVFSGAPISSVRGPLLLACNHPNSFFDAIVIGCCVRRPVHFLARGEAFRTPFARRLFRALNLIPIYKPGQNTGAHALNEESFASCEAVLSDGGIVLVFAEGNCIHEWNLRPLKKSAARVALGAWNNPLIADQFRVLPVAINYNAFGRMGKKILVHTGEAISRSDFPQGSPNAEGINGFNRLLKKRLEKGILKTAGSIAILQMLISNQRSNPGINSIERLEQKKRALEERDFKQHMHALVSPYLLPTGFGVYILNLLLAFIFSVPAIAGWLLHAPVVYPLRGWVMHKFSGTVYFDSIFFVALLLIYPVYWILMIVLCLVFVPQHVVFAVVLCMPLLGWLCIRWRDRLQKIVNYISLPRKERISIDELVN